MKALNKPIKTSVIFCVTLFFLFLHSTFFNFKCLKWCIYLTVFLVGGNKENEGNLFMTNQQSKIYGPVCADYFWKIQNVSKASKNFKLYIHHLRL